MNEINYKYRLIMILKKAMIMAVLTGALSLSAHDGEAPHTSPTEPITAEVQTGQGPHTYTTVPGWGKVPGSDYLGSTHGGIVVDQAGLVYVSTNGSQTLCVFKEDGTFVKSFGPKFKGIHGMNIHQIDGEEFIFAAAMGKVMKIALTGEVVMTISGKDKGWKKATAIAVAPNGQLFIADGYGSSKIFIYSKDGQFVKEFGIKGSGDGQFKTSHGLAIDTRGAKPVLLVCDRENKRLQTVDLETLEIKVVTTNLRRPCALSLWGEYTAVAELEGRVVILDKNYQVVSKIGDNPDKSQWAKNPVKPEAWQAGIFTAPHGVSFDAKGNLYVQDWNKWGRITKLNRNK
jgi:hypothetical protein